MLDYILAPDRLPNGLWKDWQLFLSIPICVEPLKQVQRCGESIASGMSGLGNYVKSRRKAGSLVDVIANEGNFSRNVLDAYSGNPGH